MTKTDRHISLALGRRPRRIQADAALIGDDITMTIWGGTKPHIGSVAIALPRPSLADPDKISATTSVYNCTGHKDESVARMFAEHVAAALDRKVVAIAGIHIDNASRKDIDDILALSATLCERLIKKISKVLK